MVSLIHSNDLSILYDYMLISNHTLYINKLLTLTRDNQNVHSYRNVLLSRTKQCPLKTQTEDHHQTNIVSTLNPWVFTDRASVTNDIHCINIKQEFKEQNEACKCEASIINSLKILISENKELK